MTDPAIQHWRTLKGTPKGTPDELRKRFGQSAPPVDPYAIARGIGVEVKYTKERQWSGAVKFSGERAVIWLNDTEGRRRKRFTLAHELGHLMLHGTDGEGLFRDATFGGSGDEIAANAFAAELLMPENLVRKYSGSAGFDVRRLSNLFDVSVEALQIRLAKLAEREVAVLRRV